MSSDPHEGASGTGPGSEGEQVGSVAEEAARLFGALSDWGREHGPDVGRAAEDLDGLADRTTAAARDLADRVVRAASPEVRGHLADAASSLSQAASGFFAALGAPRAPTGHAEPAGGLPVDRVDDLDTDHTGWPEEEPS